MHGCMRLARCASTHPRPLLRSLRPKSSSAVADPAASQEFAPKVVDFRDSEIAFASKTTPELIRGLFVFRLCQLRPLVTHAETVMKLSYKLLGPSATNFLAKTTFFGHFCAGEDSEGIAPTVKRLEDYGVGSILDYAAESDLEETPKDANKPSPASAATSGAHDPNIDIPGRVQYAEDLVVSRVYDYASEAQCDEHMRIFKTCIRAVHDVSPAGFAAIKVTALGNPLLLERISTAITELRHLFDQFDSDGNGLMSTSEFMAAYDQHFTDAHSAEMTALLHDLDPNGSDMIDYVQWTNSIKIEELAILTNKCRTRGPLAAASLDENEVQLMQAMRRRLEELAVLAETLGVRMMIDAEHTYFQPAIDYLTAGLQAKYNRKYPAIFGTYQMYLQDSYPRLITDMTRAERHGFHFAAKLVRGAYMVLERKRAKEQNLADPIFPTIEHTHANYHKGMEEVLERIADGRGVEVMFATHNQRSIIRALEKMNALGLPPHAGVYFGQLLGMSDHLTFSLGHHAYKAYKYVPFGPVGEVMPYLVRRAQENSDMLGGASVDRVMFLKELKRRMGLKWLN